MNLTRRRFLQAMGLGGVAVALGVVPTLPAPAAPASTAGALTMLGVEPIAPPAYVRKTAGYILNSVSIHARGTETGKATITHEGKPVAFGFLGGGGQDTLRWIPAGILTLDSMDGIEVQVEGALVASYSAHWTEVGVEDDHYYQQSHSSTQFSVPLGEA